MFYSFHFEDMFIFIWVWVLNDDKVWSTKQLAWWWAGVRLTPEESKGIYIHIWDSGDWKVVCIVVRIFNEKKYTLHFSSKMCKKIICMIIIGIVELYKKRAYVQIKAIVLKTKKIEENTQLAHTCMHIFAVCEFLFTLHRFYFNTHSECLDN